MKKRILSGLCAVLLCLGFLTVPIALGAAGTPCFLAVNDNLQPLEDQFIPIAVSGQYYVPYTALDNSITGVSLGVFPIYDPISNTLMIYSREKVITFDLTAGTCTDRNGNNLTSVRAVTRNGRIYVPARFICEHFGLFYSSRITTYGPMVRIRSSSSILDDNQFVGLSQMLMEARLRDWRKAQAEEETPVVTPTPTPSQTITTPTPDTDKSDVNMYLAFRADQPGGLEALLTRLEYYQVNALFFFPAAELAEYDEAVRSVLCGGHAVGLIVSGTTAEEVSEQAAQGNRLLAQIAHMSTYTLLAPDVKTDDERQEIESAGLLCWNTDVDAIPDGRSVPAQASTVLTNADQYRSEVYILSDTSAVGAVLMGQLLPELVQDRYDLRLAVETEI